MITVELLGGLGNQMFIYAAARSLQIETNDKLRLDITWLKKYNSDAFRWNALKHFDIKYLEFVDMEKSPVLFSFFIRLGRVLPHFSYHLGKYLGYNVLRVSQGKRRHLPLTHYTNNVYIYGLWQSPKYFDKYNEIIRQELSVNTPVMEQNNSIYKRILNSESVCVHVRRGDYVDQGYIVCGSHYYHESIKYIAQNTVSPVFFIFSDDIEWTKKNVKLENYNYVYVDNNNPNYEELRLMYSCKHFVMSNSTFSWWAQYLCKNKDKIVVAPNRWSRGSSSKIDLYMDNWVLMDVNS